jgi:hypothetical protein
VIRLEDRYVGGYGSILEVFTDPFGLPKVVANLPIAPPSPVDVANGFVDLVKGAFGGDRSPAADVVREHRERSGCCGHCVGRASHEGHDHDQDDDDCDASEAHAKFANPYRDRSLQLRFIPVFRRFEVVTEVKQPEVGGEDVDTGLRTRAAQRDRCTSRRSCPS